MSHAQSRLQQVGRLTVVAGCLSEMHASDGDVLLHCWDLLPLIVQLIIV